MGGQYCLGSCNMSMLTRFGGPIERLKDLASRSNSADPWNVRELLAVVYYHKAIVCLRSI